MAVAVRAPLWGHGRPALLAALVLFSCGPGIPAEWTVDLVADVTLGADPVTPQTAFYRPLDIGIAADGRVFVLDSGNHRVQVFDAAGAWVGTLGRPGEGPGELADPFGMWVYPDGHVVVADTRNGRLQPFGAGGEALDPIDVDYTPLDVVGGSGRLYVLRMPNATLVLGPDPRPLIQVLSRSGQSLFGLFEATPTNAGALYLLENSLRLAAAPANGVAAASTHFRSRMRVYDGRGRLRREIPILYKAGAWAPLGQRPTHLDDDTLEGIARTATDLAWDPVRRLWWVLAGYSDRTPEGEWIIGHEIYRYDPSGEYRGSAILPFHGVALSAAPDGRVWIVDNDGVVHGMRVRDPEGATAAADRPPAGR